MRSTARQTAPQRNSGARDATAVRSELSQSQHPRACRAQPAALSVSARSLTPASPSLNGSEIRSGVHMSTMANALHNLDICSVAPGCCKRKRPAFKRRRQRQRTVRAPRIRRCKRANVFVLALSRNPIITSPNRRPQRGAMAASRGHEGLQARPLHATCAQPSRHVSVT